MSAPSRLAVAVLTLTFAAACSNKEDTPAVPSATAAASHAPPAPTAAATPPPSASASAAPAKAAACTLLGAWTGNYPPGPFPFSGTPLDFTLNADGTGLTHSARADQDLAWKTEGSTFSLHGIKAQKGGRFSCAQDQIGQYSWSFSADCNTLTFKLAKDPCKGRTLTMDGLVVKRK